MLRDLLLWDLVEYCSRHVGTQPTSTFRVIQGNKVKTPNILRRPSHSEGLLGDKILPSPEESLKLNLPHVGISLLPATSVENNFPLEALAAAGIKVIWRRC